MLPIEEVVLVDENDQMVGVKEKMEAHRLGLLHRAFSIFIFRKGDQKELELLLQRRHPLKYHCGGLWTNTCCSHPRLLETVLEAANRRLQEEMGIQTHLYPLGTFQYKAKLENGLIEHELDHVFVGRYDNDVLSTNEEEVAETRWVSIPTLQKALLSSPHMYTPWLSQALDLILKKATFLTQLFE